VLLVLGLLSITLALAYAMMRTEATVQQVQRNGNHSGMARQAAMTGISVAMRKMGAADWAGVDTDVLGDLGGGMSYRVTYATGDEALTPDSPDYAEYPYRVTLTSTGMANDPADPAIQATHTVQAVVQLVRRKLVDEPSSWTSVTPYTVYQWGTGRGREGDIEFPARFEGPVFFQNAINYMLDYPNDGDDKAFHGSIDEVAILATALSGDEIEDLDEGKRSLASLMTNPAKQAISWWRLDEPAGATVAIDELGNYNGRYDGGKPGATPEPTHGGSASANFDGFDDQIDLGPVDVGGSQMTILAWFKVDSFRHSDGRILSKSTSADADDHFWMLSTINSSGHKRLRFRLKTNSEGTSTLIATSKDISAGDWVFAAAVYDGTKMRLYQDGELVGSRSKRGAMSTDPTVLAAIGNNPPASPRAKLLRDLNAMRVAGQGDFRPFSGPINAPLALTSKRNRNLLMEETDLPLHNVAQGSGTAPVAHPGDIESYQLYPGGKTYFPRALSRSIANATYEPDPKTNPLGIFKYRTEVRLRDKVTIRGTLLTYDSGVRGDVEIRGQGVKIEPVDLPRLYGDTTTYQLPSIIARDDLRVFDESSSSISGLALCWDDFEIEQCDQNVRLDFQGKLIAGEVELRARNEWDRSSTWWKERLREFLLQTRGPAAIPFFPKWLRENRDLDYKPAFVLKADPAGVSYHWHDWSRPLFVPDPDDGGLRWDLVRWRDNP